MSACGAPASNQTNQAAGAAAGTATSFPIHLTDDVGHSVTLEQAPKHIVSTTEGTDEILFALVPKSNIAMVTSFASNPDFSNITSFVKGIPAVSDAGADVEQIIAQRPDLVLMASYTKPGVVKQIEQANIPSYEFNSFNSISDIEKNIGVVGKLVGEPDKASNLVGKMKKDIDSIQSSISGQKKPTVLNYSSFGFAAGTNTIVNDVIVDAGGINAAAGLSGWAKISDEQIVKMNPDVIIDASNDKGFFQKLMNNKALQTVPAIKNHRLYFISGADLESVSQYVVNGVYDVAHVLYPSATIPAASFSKS